MPSVLDNREWATLIWLTLGVLWMLSRPDFRPSVKSFLGVLLHPKILVCEVALAACVFGLVMFGKAAGIWTDDLASATVVWFLVSGMVLLMRSTGVSEESGFLRRTLLRAVGVGVVVEGFVNLYVFPLPVELFLVPVLV